MREWQDPDSDPSTTPSLIPPRALLGYFPWWAMLFVALLFGYAIVNFFLATGLLAGKVTSDALSAAQSARAFSGHWMLFYGLPMVFFGFVPPDARPARDAAA